MAADSQQKPAANQRRDSTELLAADIFARMIAGGRTAGVTHEGVAEQAFAAAAAFYSVAKKIKE